MTLPTAPCIPRNLIAKSTELLQGPPRNPAPISEAMGPANAVGVTDARASIVQSCGRPVLLLLIIIITMLVLIAHSTATIQVSLCPHELGTTEAFAPPLPLAAGTRSTSTATLTASIARVGLDADAADVSSRNYDSGVAMNDVAVRHNAEALVRSGRVSPEPPKVATTMGPKYCPESWRDVGKAMCLAALDLIALNPHSRLGAPDGGGLARQRFVVSNALAKYEKMKSAPRPPKEGDSAGEDDDATSAYETADSAYETADDAEPSRPRAQSADDAADYASNYEAVEMQAVALHA